MFLLERHKHGALVDGQLGKVPRLRQVRRGQLRGYFGAKLVKRHVEGGYVYAAQGFWSHGRHNLQVRHHVTVGVALRHHAD